MSHDGDTKEILKAMTVGAGMVGGHRVFSGTMPSQKEDLETGLKTITSRVITFADYKFNDYDKLKKRTTD